MDLYSVMCVSDLSSSVAWFDIFFGRPADEVIGAEHLWQVGENAWLVVDARDVRADRVGGAMVTWLVNRRLCGIIAGTLGAKPQA